MIKDKLRIKTENKQYLSFEELANGETAIDISFYKSDGKEVYVGYVRITKENMEKIKQWL